MIASQKLIAIAASGRLTEAELTNLLQTGDSGASLTSLNASNISSGTLAEARLSDSGELTPTLVNSYGQGTNPARYRKLAGQVSLMGQIERTTFPSNVIAFTLSAGYRPLRDASFVIVCTAETNLQRVPVVATISTTGAVAILWTAGAPTAALSGRHIFDLAITFPVA